MSRPQVHWMGFPSCYLCNEGVSPQRILWRWFQIPVGKVVFVTKLSLMCDNNFVNIQLLLMRRTGLAVLICFEATTPTDSQQAGSSSAAVLPL